MNSGGDYGSGKDIIREALRRELESAPLSPPEPAWACIRAGLFRKKKNRGPARMRPSLMRRVAAACAILLVVLAGGLALRNAGLLAPPGLWERDFAKMGSNAGEAAGDMILEKGPPQAPCGGFTPANTGEGGYFQAGDHYPAAVYRRGKERLLWIRAISDSMDLPEFVAGLGRQLGGEIEILDGEAGVHDYGRCGPVLEFKAGGRPGIAWRLEGRPCALLALSGSPDLRELIPLWDAGEQPCLPPE